MNSRRILLRATCALMLVVAVPAHAQLQDESTEVVLAALSHIRALMPEGPVAVDTARFEPRELIDRVLDRMGAPRTTVEAEVTCRDRGRWDCTLEGSGLAAIIYPADRVSFAPPREGEPRSAEMFVWVKEHIVFESGRTQIFSQGFRVRLVRDGTGWKVTESIRAIVG